MAEVKTAGAKSATGESGMSKATATQQDQTLALRLTPVNNSDQLVLANTSNVQLAPGVAHFDINQVRAVCACFASVCGTVDRHDTAGVFRSGVVLELKRPTAQAGGVSGLLQLASGALLTAGVTPAERGDGAGPVLAKLDGYGWQVHCRGLFQTTVAA